MIPRHPGDPERLPKVSKRASGTLLMVGSPLGWFWFGAAGALGRGDCRCPKLYAHHRADRCEELPRPAPDQLQRWAKGERRGRRLKFYISSPEDHLFKGSKEQLF